LVVIGGCEDREAVHRAFCVGRLLIKSGHDAIDDAELESGFRNALPVGGHGSKSNKAALASGDLDAGIRRATRYADDGYHGGLDGEGGTGSVGAVVVGDDVGTGSDRAC